MQQSLEEKIAAQFRASRDTRAAEATETPTDPVVETPADPKETAGPVTFKAAYVSDDGVIYGIGAYAENIDLDDEVLRTKALVGMAYDFCSATNRVFKANHQDVLAADLVASMPGAPILKSGRILAAGEDVPEDDPITGICLKSQPIAWFVGVRPQDPAISEMARKGGVAGFSFGALVAREAIKE